jgi:predicted RND superfamily exporter protein
MAIGVIGGLVLSTALSLVVVPAFYVVADKLGRKKKKTAVRAAPSPATPPASH